MVQRRSPTLTVTVAVAAARFRSVPGTHGTVAAIAVHVRVERRNSETVNRVRDGTMCLPTVVVYDGNIVRFDFACTSGAIAVD